MKKVFITLAVVLGMATAANAQLLIGGGINFNGGTDKTVRSGEWGAQSKFSNFGFGISPIIGYQINGKFEVGAKIVLDYDHSTTYAAIENINGKEAAKFARDSRTTSFDWSINPYARYRLFDVKGFGFWLQGEAELGTTLERKTKYYAYGSDETNISRKQDVADKMNEKRPGHKYSKFNGAFYVQPVLTYALDGHWTIYSELNLLSLGVWGSVEKTTEEFVPGSTTVKTVNREGKEEAITDTRNTCNFNLGLFQGRALTLGVVYKF